MYILQNSLSLDLGPSFMDEVMRALNEASEPKPAASKGEDTQTLLDERSPLIEREAPFGDVKTSFDNAAMSSDLDSMDSRTLSSTDLDLDQSVDVQNEENSAMDSSLSSKGTPELRMSEVVHDEDGDLKRNFRPKLKIVSKFNHFCPSLSLCLYLYAR